MNTSQKIIGTGKYSKVIEMVSPEGKKVAVKVIKPEDLNYTEIDMLTRIKSPYLVRSVKPIVRNTDYGEGVALELKEKNLLNFDISQIPPGQLKRMVMTLIYGLECIHKSGFLHLDIKPGNSLYNYQDSLYTCYISDFGFSISCEDVYKGIEKDNRIGTMKYFPYETLEKTSPFIYNDKSDVWSLGVTILVFLGFKIKLNFGIMEKTNSKTSIVKQFWDSLDINKEVENVVNNLNISELDKLDLYEMLTNMLKKEQVDRISSKDFSKLRFYTSNTLENSCYLEKGKEFLYIPYSSSYVLTGINCLRNYFKNIYYQSHPKVYFLAVEIFIRIMNISDIEISKETLDKNIKNSFLVAMKYYKNIKISRNEYIALAKDGYKMIKYLEGSIAPNKFYHEAEYVEDLKLFDEIVLKNYNLISFYNFLEPDKVFQFFRQNYSYDKLQKDKLKDMNQLFGLGIPGKNTESMIENDRNIFSYKDNLIKTETKIMGENVKNITKLRSLEEQFRKNIINYLTSTFQLEKYENVFQKVKDTKNIYGLYLDFFKDKDVKVYDIFLNLIPEINYYIITQDTFGNLKTYGKESNNNIIFISEEGNSSLIKLDANGGIAKHYYSNYNQNLEEYFKNKNINYSNDYTFGTVKFCKIPELCILFMIYLSEIKGLVDYDMIFIEDKTLKIMLNLCIVVYDSIKK
tara:strand:- start:141 stop:2198 length:2058 start_codon:yes stop_codon:yes gene_type:complete